MEPFLLHAFVYLVAAVAMVPLAKRFGLGAVLGYLVAGAVIGPHCLGFIGRQGSSVASVAEFGVVMMLFLVGLELQPRLLWKMRAQLLGLGGLQVFGTAAVIAGLGAALGFGLKVSFAAGLILAMSSTAIVLQSLQERGLFKTPAGQSAFAVLLFQDVSVIPIFAILPLLAVSGAVSAEGAGETHPGLIASFPGWLQALIVLAAVAGVVAAGRYVVNPAFRAIAGTKLRELFTAAALLLVVSVALGMHQLGMSPALGTFLAGVVLADSEFRHELEADIEPFKGLLLGLFFISVGAGIDFVLIGGQPGKIALLVLAFMTVKAVVLYSLGRSFKMETPDCWLFALSLAQGGEFAFVLLSFVVDHGVLTRDQASPLVAAVALSMALTPLLFLAYEKLIAPRWSRKKAPERATDTIESHDYPVIIAGFGRFGLVVGRMLQVNGFSATILDLDPAQVDIIRRLGMKVFYGDATRLELLQAAGAEKAKLFIIAIDDEERSVALAEVVRKHFPNLRILVRASGRIHAFRLLRIGVTEVYRETLDSSLRVAVDALRALGVRGYQAERAAKKFRIHDERVVRELADFWEKDEEIYFGEARRLVVAVEQAFASDREKLAEATDEGWDTPAVKTEDRNQKSEVS